jgi:hypothetical protein
MRAAMRPLCFALGLLFAALFGAGCGASHRAVAAFAPESFAQDPDDGALVEVVRVDRKGVYHDTEPERFTDRSGRALERPVGVRGSDTLRIRTPDPDVRVRLLLRRTGLLARADGFRAIHAVSGTVDRRFPTEIRTLPDRTPLEGILVLPVRVLEHPQNGWRLGENDLLMVEAVRLEDPSDPQSQPAETQRRLFLRRTPGVVFGGFAGVLATMPLQGEEGRTAVTPILAAGPTLGVRTARVAGPARALDVLELVTSVGIGSTALADVQPDGVRVQVSGLFDAALVGGGFRFLRVLTVQGYFNATSLFRNGAEAPGTLAVGVDAAGLTALFRRAGLRVFRPHPLPDALYETADEDD